MATPRLTPQSVEAAIRDALGANDSKLALRIASNFVLKVLKDLREDTPGDAARLTAEVAAGLQITARNLPRRVGRHEAHPLTVFNDTLNPQQQQARRQPS
jgi:hypothetical protein